MRMDKDSPEVSLIYLMELQKQLRWYIYDSLELNYLDPLRIEVEERINALCGR